MNTKDIYSTSSLDLATAISLYVPLWAIDKSNPSKAEFLFQRQDNLEKIVENFWRGELRVDPLKYFIALKTLKSRLYEK